MNGGTFTFYGCIIPLDEAVELVILFVEAGLLTGHLTALCNLNGIVCKFSK